MALSKDTLARAHIVITDAIVQAMVAENQERVQNGNTPAYGEEAFTAVAKELADKIDELS